MSNKRKTIGAVSEKTGCNIETIRFYEKEGLLPTPERSSGGHRLYTADHISRLYFIRRCRDLGFSMDEIRQLLSLADGHEVSCERVKHIADKHLSDIRRKIADLQKMEKTLGELSSSCSGKDVPECPMLDVLHARA